MTILLVTFGCSWVYGVGAGYKPDMNNKDYEKVSLDADVADELSFRALISKKYGLENVNFSIGGSSNQKQFRLAREFFSSSSFEKLKQVFTKIIVLWGITSTARNEVWSTEHNQLKSFTYSGSGHCPTFSKFFLTHLYNHENELQNLKTEMQHWNTFFKNTNIENLWVDTFNHHNYESVSPEITNFKKKIRRS
jgi:hypothetical protein